jgi:rare lipoprotein A (peptidoglycan hydrolase)
MRQYGLPESYYAKTGTGVQEGFRKLIENDVSNIELEDRISTAQKRVLNANPEVTQAIKQFYPDITNADILAYTLDPKNAIENIKRKVTTAEIGGAAIQSGLQTGLTRAEQLQAAGVTKDTAQQGYGTIAGGLQRGSQLASIYGEDPYTQTTAETEVFNIAGAQGARKQRQKITGLEKATFGGQSGISSGALTRDRAGGY